MGTDKALLKLGGFTLLERTAHLLNEVCGRVVISSGNPDHMLPGTETWPDELPGQAAMVGLYSVMNRSSEPFSLVLSCDMPGITVPFLRYLLSYREQSEAVVPMDADGNLEPLCAVYQRGILPRLDKEVLSGSYTLRTFINRLQVKYVEVNPSVPGYHPNLFANMNTPGDLQEFQITKKENKA